MRITKPPRTEDPRVIQKQQALRGMDTCPSCHSKHVWHEGTNNYTERASYLAKEVGSGSV